MEHLDQKQNAAQGEPPGVLAPRCKWSCVEGLDLKPGWLDRQVEENLKEMSVWLEDFKKWFLSLGRWDKE